MILVAAADHTLVTISRSRNVDARLRSFVFLKRNPICGLKYFRRSTYHHLIWLELRYQEIKILKNFGFNLRSYILIYSSLKLLSIVGDSVERGKPLHHDTLRCSKGLLSEVTLCLNDWSLVHVLGTFLLWYGNLKDLLGECYAAASVIRRPWCFLTKLVILATLN